MVQYRKTEETFAALGDPVRMATLERLGEGGASISELAEPAGMSLTGMKKHIAILEEAGFVVTRKTGRVRTCALGPRGLEHEAAWIERYRQLWQARFDALDTLVADLQQTPSTPSRPTRK